MTTRITTSPAIAARFIRSGEIVAFPTETVYGLGADAFNESAIRKIFRAKGRPADNPLIVHVSTLGQIEQVSRRIPPIASRFIEAFFPGPLTVILPKRKDISMLISAGLPTVGIRMPSHPVTRRFLRECGVPVVAPSANRSGMPSPTTWQAVRSDLDGSIACILKGAQTRVGLESTVVDCTGRVPEILRAGAVSLEELRGVVPSTRLARRAGSPKSPGLKYRHYAPHARVLVVSAPDEIPAGAAGGGSSAYIGLARPDARARFRLTRVCRTVGEYARALFLFFRRCDAGGVEQIYCQSVPERGLGLALMDRVRRAAAAAAAPEETGAGG